MSAVLSTEEAQPVRRRFRVSPLWVAFSVFLSINFAEFAADVIGKWWDPFYTGVGALLFYAMLAWGLASSFWLFNRESYIPGAVMLLLVFVAVGGADLLH